jgi:hypothetical protein
MNTFFVPYHLIKYMTLKSGNVYRHTLSWRVYLYLAHFHSGRIEWKERKHLVEIFKSSHTAIHKALAYLQEEGFCEIKSGWITIKGEEKTRKLVLPHIGRNFNISFEFKLETILSRTKFYNYLFLSIYQSSAMVRGKNSKTVQGYGNMKKMIRCTPQAKTNSDSVMLKGGHKVNSPYEQSVNFNGSIQRQSSTYQAKMTDRHPMSSYKRIKKIIKDNNIMDNECGMFFHYNLKYVNFAENKEGKSEFYSSQDAFELMKEIKNPSARIVNDVDVYQVMYREPFVYSFMIPTQKAFKRFKNSKFELPSIIQVKDLQEVENVFNVSSLNSLNPFDSSLKGNMKASFQISP